MINKNPKRDRHEEARQMTEAALEAMARGDDKRASELVQKAKRTDITAIEEVLQDLDEDAGSNHEVPGEDRL